MFKRQISTRLRFDRGRYFEREIEITLYFVISNSVGEAVRPNRTTFHIRRNKNCITFIVNRIFHYHGQLSQHKALEQFVSSGLPDNIVFLEDEIALGTTDDLL